MYVQHVGTLFEEQKLERRFRGSHPRCTVLIACAYCIPGSKPHTVCGREQVDVKRDLESWYFNRCAP